MNESCERESGRGRVGSVMSERRPLGLCMFVFPTSPGIYCIALARAVSER